MQPKGVRKNAIFKSFLHIKLESYFSKSYDLIVQALAHG